MSPKFNLDIPIPAGVKPPGKAPPPFQTEKGVQFYARDSDGNWFYVNHAGIWCQCPPLVRMLPVQYTQEEVKNGR